MSQTEAQADTAAESQRAVFRARATLLDGRGPGASAAEIVNHGRGKLVQGGLPVIRRLAVTARDVARARGDPVFVDGGLVPDLENPPDEVTRTASDESGPSARRARDARSPRDRRVRDVVIAALVLVVLLARRCTSKHRRARHEPRPVR